MGQVISCVQPSNKERSPRTPKPRPSRGGLPMLEDYRRHPKLNPRAVPVSNDASSRIMKSLSTVSNEEEEQSQLRDNKSKGPLVRFAEVDSEEHTEEVPANAAQRLMRINTASTVTKRTGSVTQERVDAARNEVDMVVDDLVRLADERDANEDLNRLRVREVFLAHEEYNLSEGEQEDMELQETSQRLDDDQASMEGSTVRETEQGNKLKDNNSSRLLSVQEGIEMFDETFDSQMLEGASLSFVDMTEDDYSARDSPRDIASIGRY